MIELNKKDIEVVAINRHTHSRKWHLIGWLVALLVALIVTVKLTPTEMPLVMALISFIPVLVIYAIGAVWYVKSQNKAVRDFLKECGNAPNIKVKL